MLNQSFHHAIEAATTNQLRSALHLLLRSHAEPVFGAAKAVEHEVAALNAPKVLGHINRAADEYDLVANLRVTKSKARSLAYQAALRAEYADAQIEVALRHVLHTTRLVRDGGPCLIEVPDPLMMDRLRKRIRSSAVPAISRMARFPARSPKFPKPRCSALLQTPFLPLERR